MGDEKNCVFHQDLKERVDDHEKRIDTLEKNEVRNDERVSNLCDKLDKLSNWIEKLVITIVATLITGGAGFIIWYIQSLPR